MGYEKAGGRDVWGGPCSGTRFLSGDIASTLLLNYVEGLHLAAG